MFAPRGWLKRPVYKKLYSSISSSHYFDRRWYRGQNMGLIEKLTDPVWHYIGKGWKLGLDPSPRFDTRFYISHNSDVASAGINPLFHFIEYGAPERRAPVRPGRVTIGEAFLLAAPLRLFEEKPIRRRITLVVDDNTPAHPILGDAPTVATAHEVAAELSAGLRVISLRRADSGEKIPNLPIEWLSVDKGSSYGDLSHGPGELWIATSGSGAASLNRHVGAIALNYWATGCELCLLPAGMGRVIARETLRGRAVPVFAVGDALATHLTQSHKISVAGNRTVPRKPFSSEVAERQSERKPAPTGVLSFLATPDQSHTLFARGVEALELALSMGTLPTNAWEIRFFGSNLPSLSLLNSVVVTPQKPNDDGAYTAALGGSNVVVALDATGAISPVALDALDAGRVVVTNVVGNTTSKTPKNMVNAASDSAEDIAEAIRVAVEAATTSPKVAGSKEVRSTGKGHTEDNGLAPVLREIKKLLGNA